MSRRKLKSERELVCDIRKRHKVYCESILCNEKGTCEDCLIKYLKRLLFKYREEEEEFDNSRS